MKVRAFGASPLNSAEEKSKPGCCSIRPWVLLIFLSCRRRCELRSILTMLLAQAMRLHLACIQPFHKLEMEVHLQK